MLAISITILFVKVISSTISFL